MVTAVEKGEAMAKKIFWLGTLVLVFGMTVVGCADRRLNGTWVNMDGNNGRLTSDSNGRVIGTAELLDRNTINITLNLNSVSPWTYTLKKQ